MVAYTYRMPAGVPGAVNRAQHATVEAQVFDGNNPVTAYGRFVKIVSEKVRPIASGDAASVVYGLLVRPFPANSSQEGIGVATPPTTGVAEVLRRGYMTVKLNQGTAAKNGQVYVRVTAAGGKLVGDIETAADSGNCVAVSGCVFTGPADAGGAVEVAFNI
jgi:hypothetical protein